MSLNLLISLHEILEGSLVVKLLVLLVVKKLIETVLGVTEQQVDKRPGV